MLYLLLIPLAFALLRLLTRKYVFSALTTVSAGAIALTNLDSPAAILIACALFVSAIGDYFNDYEMLKAVGLPACCGQAPQGMKKIAKLVTCHCNKGAVADLIDYIIKNNT